MTSSPRSLAGFKGSYIYGNGRWKGEQGRGGVKRGGEGKGDKKERGRGGRKEGRRGRKGGE